MKKRLLLLLALSAISGYSQETLVRANGQKITINENGTWKYQNSTLKTDENDCAKYIKTSVNPETGLINASAIKQLTLSKDNGETGLSIVLMNTKDNTTTIFSIKTIDINCIYDKTKIAIVFSDGSSSQITSNGSYNCEGRTTLYFGGVFGGKENLQQLASKDINTIMIATETGIVSYEFNENEAQIIKNTLNCLSNSLLN